MMTNEQLANAVVSRFCEAKLKIATAESCTGGLVAAYLTSISGSSNVIECGIIAYANRIKQSQLNVSVEDLTVHGAVSKQVAIAMADSIRIKSNADFGVSTTGIAGPTGGTDEKPVGTVHIAVSTKKKIYHEKLELLEECGNNRDQIRNTTVNRVFTLVLLALEEQF
ncbi:MAG: CinA family protein [Oscillospiraceae bacterium]